jgi:hypothetical protein
MRRLLHNLFRKFGDVNFKNILHFELLEQITVAKSICNLDIGLQYRMDTRCLRTLIKSPKKM